MKKYIFLTLFAISLQLHAQDYPEMVVEGATWINEYPSASSTEQYFVYHIEGDTTLNNVSYKILNQQDFEIGEDDILRLLDTGTPVALLRENIAEKKVYSMFLEDYEFISGNLEDFELSRLPGEYENEYLLYDYSLEVGDIIDSEFSREIFEIEEVEYFGYNVRWFNVSPGDGYYERVGHVLTLFHPYQIAFIGGTASQVVQFCGDDSEPCIYLTKPSSNKNISQTGFSISPNPAHNYITINSGEDILQSIRLYAADGSLIYTLDEINLNEMSIDLSFISYTGLIHVVSTSEKGASSSSFIKM